MLNALKLLRYLFFAVFVISNAIITSAAIWNLSVVVGIGDVVATAISTYLIIPGVLGLFLIFTVILCDLFGKDISRVWFELLWVILFFIMELAGAAAITARNGQVCDSNSSVSSCVSAQVLQAFTWICAILLFGYFFLLFVSAILRSRDDATIWNSSVRKIIWQQSRMIDTAPLPPLPSFHNQVPVVAAPRPRRIMTMPQVGLSHRSGLSLDYEIEHYRPPATEATDPGPSADAPLSPLPLFLQPPPMPATAPSRVPLQQPQKPLPAAFAPFYPSYVQSAITPGLSTQRRFPQATSSSPPPLGDWPRHDAISLPARGKRKQNAPTPYSFTLPTAQQHHDQPTRSRPSGPRQRSDSSDQRPPSLDQS